MNLEYQQNRAAVSGALTLGATIGAAIATRGGSALSRLLGAQSDVATVSASGAVGLGTILATYPDAGDFPFTAGDVVTYTITVCNDGAGGADADLDITIGG